MNFNFIVFKKNLLGYSWFTILCFSVEQNESFIYIHSFLDFFFFRKILLREYSVEFPVLYSRSLLLVIYFIYSNVHMPIPIFQFIILLLRASLVALMVKNPPAMQETWVRSLGWDDPLEEGMATHSSILAWRIPMDRGAWQAIVHGIARSQTQLSD